MSVHGQTRLGFVLDLTPRASENFPLLLAIGLESHGEEERHARVTRLFVFVIIVVVVAA